MIVMLTCGLIGGEAKNFLQKRLGKIYAEKTGDTYCCAQYNNTVLDISPVRACHLCLRGSGINCNSICTSI